MSPSNGTKPSSRSAKSIPAYEKTYENACKNAQATSGKHRKTSKSKKKRQRIKSIATQTERKSKQQHKSLKDSKSTGPSIEALKFWGRDPGSGVNKSVSRAKSLMPERAIYSVHSFKHKDSSPTVGRSNRPRSDSASTVPGVATQNLEEKKDSNPRQKGFKPNPSPLIQPQAPCHAKADGGRMNSKPSRSNCTLDAVSSLMDVGMIPTTNELKVKDICDVYEELSQCSKNTDAMNPSNSGRFRHARPVVAHSYVQCDLQKDQNVIATGLCETRTNGDLIEQAVAKLEAVVKLQNSVTSIVAVALHTLQNRSCSDIAVENILENEGRQATESNEAARVKDSILNDEHLKPISDASELIQNFKEDRIICSGLQPDSCTSVDLLISRNELPDAVSEPAQSTPLLADTKPDGRQASVGNTDLDGSECGGITTVYHEDRVDGNLRSSSSNVFEAKMDLSTSQTVGVEWNESTYGQEMGSDEGIDELDQISSGPSCSGVVLTEGRSLSCCSSRGLGYSASEDINRTVTGYSIFDSSTNSSETFDTGVALPQLVKKSKKSLKERLAKAFRWRKHEAQQPEQRKSGSHYEEQLNVDELFENLPPPTSNREPMRGCETKKYRSGSTVKSSKTSIPHYHAPSPPMMMHR